MEQNGLLIPQVASGQVFFHIHKNAIKIRQRGSQVHRNLPPPTLALTAAPFLNGNPLFFKPLFLHIWT